MRAPTVVRATAIIVVATACADPTRPAEASPLGTYVLDAVDGEPLPVIWEYVNGTSGAHNRLVSATLTLDADGTCREQQLWEHVGAKGGVLGGGKVIGCTYAAARGEVRFVFGVDRRNERGALRDGALTLRRGARALVYRRAAAGPP